MTNHRHSHLTDITPDTNRGFGKHPLHWVVACLWLAIVATGYAVSMQANEHQQALRTLKGLQKELNYQQTEHQRLLIEQQTFSATPQVAKRAVTQMGMFFPDQSNRRVVSPTANIQSPSATQGDKP